MLNTLLAMIFSTKLELVVPLSVPGIAGDSDHHRVAVARLRVRCGGRRYRNELHDGDQRGERSCSETGNLLDMRFSSIDDESSATVGASSGQVNRRAPVRIRTSLWHHGRDEPKPQPPSAE